MESTSKEVGDRLRGLDQYRVDFALYGCVEVKAKDPDDAAEKAAEKYDWANHVDGGDMTLVEKVL